MASSTTQFWTLLLTFTLYGCFNTPRECNDFKNGTFEFTTTIGTRIETSVFTRDGALEIETFQGKSDTSDIRWINDCEYIVLKRNPKNMAEEKAIHIKILTTETNAYTFEYNAVGTSKKLRGKVVKID
ncbi:MAG: DNA topoisomerase IV [Flavobacteriaceae bacterium]|jgi:hypothetical protein|nr:DNA topoisomerase IV [Flavobacteriaceae bacterium]